MKNWPFYLNNLTLDHIWWTWLPPFFRETLREKKSQSNKSTKVCKVAQTRKKNQEQVRRQPKRPSCIFGERVPKISRKFWMNIWKIQKDYEASTRKVVKKHKIQDDTLLISHAYVSQYFLQYFAMKGVEGSKFQYSEESSIVSAVRRRYRRMERSTPRSLPCNVFLPISLFHLLSEVLTATLSRNFKTWHVI